MNGVGLWTFGRQVHTEAQAHLSLRGRYQVGPFCSFCSFFLSFFLSLCVVSFHSRQQRAFKQFYKPQLKVQAHLYPRGRYQVAPFCSFCLSLCVVPFHSRQQRAFKQFYKHQLKLTYQSLEGRRSPYFHFRSACRS